MDFEMAWLRLSPSEKMLFSKVVLDLEIQQAARATGGPVPVITSVRELLGRKYKQELAALSKGEDGAVSPDFCIARALILAAKEQ